MTSVFLVSKRTDAVRSVVIIRVIGCPAVYVAVQVPGQLMPFGPAIRPLAGGSP